ncbi:hypothetical protein HLB44_30150 [Aquincola sp. S2]|uniref:Universal stress protein n=1 Tax=Pseudaquabacterium terrae TaxID=2732868 RepID=A0ABX2ERI8_9BURK|nr:hypothetical protein [Aquabacterium terrae]NRF71262.1 hypothetical protein [Aquabacterium terrae]
MTTVRPIIAATDFSAPAKHAAWRAALLAEEMGAGLTLAYTLGGTALDDMR